MSSEGHESVELWLDKKEVALFSSSSLFRHSVLNQKSKSRERNRDTELIEIQLSWNYSLSQETCKKVKFFQESSAFA